MAFLISLTIILVTGVTGRLCQATLEFLLRRIPAAEARRLLKGRLTTGKVVLTP